MPAPTVFTAQRQGAALKPALDGYGNVAAAYSLRKVVPNYFGSAIKVRRSSDNAELDIPFCYSNASREFVLCTGTLQSFVGAGSGFVTTWYDQSGNGRNATQATAANQPEVITSGINSRPSINYGIITSQKNLAYSAGGTTSNWRDSFVVASWDSSNSTFPVNNGLICASATATGGTADGVGVMGVISTDSWNSASWAWPNICINGGPASMVAFPAITSPFVLRASADADIGVNGVCIGNDRNVVNRSWRGRISEVTLFSASLSAASRQKLERNQGRFFGISVS